MTKFISAEQSALLLQQTLAAMNPIERTELKKLGLSHREQRELRHQLYRLIGFIRHSRGVKVDISKLDLRFDARKRN